MARKNVVVKVKESIPFKERAARIKASAWRSKDYAEEKAGFLSEKTKNFIREKPIESILIAVGVGVLIGVGVREMARRREDERRSWKKSLRREFRNWF